MTTNEPFSIGYDTIRLYVDGSFYQHIKETLANRNITMKVEKKSSCKKFIQAASFLYGRNEETRIRLGFNKYRTTVSFEPAALIYGDNLRLAGVKEAGIAIPAISELLKIPVEDFRYSRLDFTANFRMQGKPISCYTALLEPPSYMKIQEKYEDEDGRKNGNVYYANKEKGSNRTVVIYEKKGTMRIETRFMKATGRNIRSMLKYENTASALCEEGFFERATDYYARILRKMCKGSSEGLKSILEQLQSYETTTTACSEELTYTSTSTHKPVKQDEYINAAIFNYSNILYNYRINTLSLNEPTYIRYKNSQVAIKLFSNNAHLVVDKKTFLNFMEGSKQNPVTCFQHFTPQANHQQ